MMTNQMADACMGGGWMMWVMGASGILVLVVLLLGAAALIKYLRQPAVKEKGHGG
jgi:hypothetical protein